MAQWQTVDTVIGYNGFGEIDPYLDWAFPEVQMMVTGGAVPTPRRMPILLRLVQGVTVEQFGNGSFFPTALRPPSWDDLVHVPQVYLAPSGAGPTHYFTALVRREFLTLFRKPVSPAGAVLMQTITRLCISRQLLVGTEALPTPASAPVAQAPTGDGEAGTVVVAVIDDGIPFANQRFRTAQGRSRVEHTWLQDGKANDAAQRYGYGRSLSKADSTGAPGLDTLLASSTHAGLIDEDEVYTKTGALDYGPRQGLALRTLSLRASHGAHVMDLACGYRPGHAPKNTAARGEDNRPIICVQLPAATNEGTSGASLDTHVIDGIHYILDKADDIARARGCGRLPVVINLSYGTIAGRHDGTSDIERAVDELIASRRGTSAPLQVVIAAGNSRLLKCHSVIDFKPDPTGTGPTAGRTRMLKWRVPPDSRAAAHLEIWLPKATATSRLKVRVKPPFAPWSPQLAEDTGVVRVFGESPGRGLCELRYSSVPNPTNRGVFVITLKPTEVTEDPDTLLFDSQIAPNGLWLVEIENDLLGTDEVVHAWIQRNGSRFGYLPFGRQSYFEDDNYVEHGLDGRVPARDGALGGIKRRGTLNAIATGQHAIVVASYVRKTMQIADYSGEGPSLSSGREGPDAAAPGDDSLVHGGLIASGTRSGSSVVLDGTSVAAPRMTRLIADLMAQGLPADRTTIRALAWLEEAGRSDHPSEERGGKGRIDFPSTLEVARIEP